MLFNLKSSLLPISTYWSYLPFDSLVYSIASWFILNMFYIPRQLLWLTIGYTSPKDFTPWIIYRLMIEANLEYYCVILINTAYLSFQFLNVITYDPSTSTSRIFQSGFSTSWDMTNIPPTLPDLWDKISRTQRLS